MEKIKDIIPHVLEGLSISRPETQERVERAWRESLDKKAHAHSVIAGLEKGNLIIHVDSSAWLFQLNIQKKKILTKLQTQIPQLMDIRFKIGKVK